MFERTDTHDVAGQTRKGAGPTTTLGPPPPRVVIVTECHCCGYEADGSGPVPRRCPKCGASAWARFARRADPRPAEADAEDGHAWRRTYRRQPVYRPAHHVSWAN